jgi:hypothetical protein
MLAQVGQFYSDEVDQYYSGANSYEGAKTIDAWQCRLSGFVPAPAPGRKPKAA